MFAAPAPLSAVASRARRLLDDLESRIQSGEITARSQLLLHLLSAAQAFRDSTSGPTMTVPAMSRDQLLVREALTDPLEDADADLAVAYEQLAGLRDLTRQIFNLCQAERDGLAGNLAQATSQVDTLRLWLSESDTTFLWVGDSFNDATKLHSASTVAIVPRSGVVTLGLDQAESLLPHLVAASIDRQFSAGGLPGNNLEIRAPGLAAFTGSRKEPRPELYAESAPRPDTLAHLFDGQPDSWFEWERVTIDPSQPVIKADEAYLSDPAGKAQRHKNSSLFGLLKGQSALTELPNWNCFLQWPGEVSLDTGVGHRGYPLVSFHPEQKVPLKLGIQLSLDAPQRISWLEITPYLRQGNYPQVDQILVSTDGNSWTPLLDRPAVLNPRMNRGIDFTGLTGSASNFEGVGVWPFPREPVQHLRIQLSTTASYEMPLGAAHRFALTGKHTTRGQGPIPVVGNPAALPSDLAAPDASHDTASTQAAVQEAFDVLAARRQMIGIRDILLEARHYTATAQLLSIPFTLPQPARAVSLMTTEAIPEEWPETTPEGKPWIAYELSADGGQSWKSISPQVSRRPDAVLTFETPTAQLQFRATFSRPADSPNQTPVLHSYALAVLP